VETEKAQRGHIKCSRSTHIEISGCYLHEATGYGGGGEGYGVTLVSQATNVLAEDNIFEKLRHAMLVARGANGNVFGYNYSLDQYSTGDAGTGQNYQGDVSIHGHFPFANLFEGNVFEYARIDVWWGYAGPDNTFFRNRSKRRAGNDPTSNEGFHIQWADAFYIPGEILTPLQYEYGQNVVGNRFDYNAAMTTAFDIEPDNSGIDYIHNNQDCDSSGNCTSYEDELPGLIGYSYYHESQPDFLTTWPFDPNSYQSLPAFVRRTTGNSNYYTVNRKRYLKLANEASSGGQDLGGTLGLEVLNTADNYTGVPSGSQVQVPNSDLTVNARTDDHILQGQKHINWMFNASSYLMNVYGLEVPTDIPVLRAIFDHQSTVTITSQFGDSLPLEFHDPWYYDSTSQTQPDEFRPLSDQDDGNGNVQVFLNQGDPNNLQPPYYSLKAPHFYVTQSDIWIFDHWEADPAGGADFVNGDQTRQTPVVFRQSGVTVTAHYLSALEPPGRTVSIAEGETLTIPAGSIYNVPTNAGFFGFEVAGSLTVDGTATEPVVLQIPNSTDTDFWCGFKLYGNDGSLVLRYAHILNAFVVQGIGVGKVIDANGGTLTVENCLITCRYPDLSGSVVGITADVTATITHTVLVGDGTTDFVGIDCVVGSSGNTVTLVNNTLVDFDIGIRVNTDASGGPVVLSARNNILAYYQPGYSGTIGMDLSYVDENTLAIDYNVIYGYTAADNGDCSTRDETCTINRNKVTEDPKLVDPAGGDYTLQSAESPAHDAGDPDPQYNDPDGTRNDMGAYYYDEVPSTPTGLTLSGSYGNPVELDWNANPEPDIDHYNIYRRFPDSYGYSRIGSTTDTHFEDPQVTVGKFLDPQYCYRVTAVDWIGQESSRSGQRCINGDGPGGKLLVLPREFALHSAHPNPFNPRTTLRYDLPENSRVRLTLYDLMGREVRTLVQGKETAGFKQAVWDGTDDAGRSAAAGVYLYTFQAEGIKSGKQFSGKGKLVLLK
jgi:hypothetical protein